MADPTQTAPVKTHLTDAEFYLADAETMAAKGDVHSARVLFEAAASAALVSLAKTMDDLNGKLGVCGHGYVGAICHLCLRP